MPIPLRHLCVCCTLVGLLLPTFTLLWRTTIMKRVVLFAPSDRRGQGSVAATIPRAIMPPKSLKRETETTICVDGEVNWSEPASLSITPFSPTRRGADTTSDAAGSAGGTGGQCTKAIIANPDPVALRCPPSSYEREGVWFVGQSREDRAVRYPPQSLCASIS